MISFKEVLVLNYKRIGLNEVEAMCLILLYEQKKHTNNAISVNEIVKYVTLSEQELSKVLLKLVEKGYIELKLINNVESYSLNPTIKKLGNVLEKQESGKTYKEEIQDIIATLEKYYGRNLTPKELLIIQEWFNEEYEIDVINKAINESLKLGKNNVKYIDSILSNKVKREEQVDDDDIEEVLKEINVRK